MVIFIKVTQAKHQEEERQQQALKKAAADLKAYRERYLMRIGQPQNVTMPRLVVAAADQNQLDTITTVDDYDYMVYCRLVPVKSGVVGSVGETRITTGVHHTIYLFPNAPANYSTTPNNYQTQPYQTQPAQTQPVRTPPGTYYQYGGTYPLVPIGNSPSLR